MWKFKPKSAPSRREGKSDGQGECLIVLEKSLTKHVFAINKLYSKKAGVVTV